MRKADQFAVEVHFIPLSSAEAGERRQRLRTLLLRGARRLTQLTVDRNQRTENTEAAEALQFGLVQK